MPAPVRLQLAMQGGGAKIVALMAAVQAVQDLEVAGRVQITRVAGTSAGAIVACLFAAGIEMKSAREQLAALFGDGFHQHFPPVGLRKLYGLSRGKRLWDTKPIRKALTELLKPSGKVYLANLRIPTTVIASNLTTAARIDYCKEEIVSTLLDSCALPFCFRVWNSKGNDNPVIVDGGICENLPAEVLQEEADKWGPVVGISFLPQPSTGSPASLLDFSRALLDTAINNSMTRAKLRLGPTRVHEIQTDLSTFDFDRALRLNEEAFAKIRDRAEVWFKEFIHSIEAVEYGQREQSVRPDAWKAESIAMMETIGDIFRAQHGDSKITYERCAFIVTAGSLDDEPDQLEYQLRYRIGDKPFYCQGFALSQASESGGSDAIRVTVVDEHDRAVKTALTPYLNRARPKEKNLLLSFLPPLAPHSGPYDLRFVQPVDGFMLPLKERKMDDLVVTPGRGEGLVGRIDLVLFVPQRFVNAKMIEKPGMGGEGMFGEDLEKYSCPPGYRPLGWSGRNREPNQPFGVDIELGS